MTRRSVSRTGIATIGRTIGDSPPVGRGLSPLTVPGTGPGYARAVRRFLGHHMAALAVLLCLQAAASMLAVRRDPVDRFKAVVVSRLVSESLPPLDAPPTPGPVTRA